MITSSIHTARTFNGLPAGVMRRPGASWNALACVELEGANYQQKQDRTIDSELVI